MLEPQVQPLPEMQTRNNAAVRVQAVQRGRMARRKGDIDARALLLRGLILLREGGHTGQQQNNMVQGSHQQQEQQEQQEQQQQQQQ